MLSANEELPLEQSEMEVQANKREVKAYKFQVRTNKLEVKVYKFQVRTNNLEVKVYKFQVRTNKLEVKVYKFQVRTNKREVKANKFHVRTNKFQVNFPDKNNKSQVKIPVKILKEKNISEVGGVTACPATLEQSVSVARCRVGLPSERSIASLPLSALIPQGREEQQQPSTNIWRMALRSEPEMRNDGGTTDERRRGGWKSPDHAERESSEG
ncbi:hypothetical protein EYF80_052561 [Liparis tanakae]|uniref:Uncharacterized protein n=1 Tax=Liparis tanakae TaxID=230148 RepID=A0A4Z2FA84_9TELE|nr:hypothetical protein EYF80_052561 [Liparis tanakae]